MLSNFVHKHDDAMSRDLLIPGHVQTKNTQKAAKQDKDKEIKKATMGAVDNDGPSDEEVSASSQPSYLLPQRYTQQSRGYSDDEADDNGGDELKLMEQHQHHVELASPPPPPPPTFAPPKPKPKHEMLDEPPPPPPPKSRSRRQHGRDKGKNSPRYPTTIEIQAVPPAPSSYRSNRIASSSRAKQKIHADYSHSYSSYEDDSEPSCSLPSTSYHHVSRAHSNGNHAIEGNYESFPAPSLNNSLLENSMDESTLQKSLEPLQQQQQQQQQQPKKERGQVLVHYHPQLGDEGYESTLLETQSPEVKYSRVTRAMNTATRRGDNNTKPPTNIYPRRGMHTRMIDDLREDEFVANNHSSSSSRAAVRVPQTMVSTDIDEGGGGNDEFNNAATRQIRRRVFRVAMERGIHDERRRKLLEADADVGGPSLQRLVGTVTATATGAGAGASNQSNAANNESAAPFSPGSSTVASNGYQRFHTSSAGDSHTDEGDMPLTLTTGKSASFDYTSHSMDKMESLRSPETLLLSPLSVPPSPPAQPPSYQTLVYNLISENEPEKLPQINRVMEKYLGREEELMKKLDLRYRRRRMRRELVVVAGESKDCRGAHGTRGARGGNGDYVAKEDELLLQQQQHQQQPTLESNPSMESVGSKPREIKTETMRMTSSPAKLTFVRVDSPNKERTAIMAMQSWDRTGERDWDRSNIDDAVGATGDDDGGADGGGGVHRDNDDYSGQWGDESVMMPPKIPKKTLPAAISDSTKTDVHANNANANAVMVSSIMSMDDDNNSGMIPAPTPKVNSANAAAVAHPPKPNVQHLGNQVMNERVMRERLERGRQRESSIARAATSNEEHEATFEKGTVGGVGVRGEQSSPRLKDDYSLKMVSSYSDGISVITMETKATQRRSDMKRVGDNDGDDGNGNGGGEAVYSFDEMLKRPPNSITVDSSGGGSNSNSKGNNEKQDATMDIEGSAAVENAASPLKIQRDEEKVQADKASLENTNKMDDVEARIKARHTLREEESVAARTQPREKEAAQNQVVQNVPKSPCSMKADDELDDMESLFREAKSRTSLATAPINEDEDDEQPSKNTDEEEEDMMQTPKVENTEEEEVARPSMIESILSSFDECDAESFVGKPRQQLQSELQTITSGVIEEEALPTPPNASALDDNNEENPRATLKTDSNTLEATPPPPREASDEGDANTISTTCSSHGLSTSAERAIASATRSELGRQKDVNEFHHSRSLSRRDVHSVAASSMMGSVTENDNLEEEIARLIAEKESRFQAEKVVALMKAQRELEAERRARLEAEAAWLKVEEELMRLKLEKKQEEKIVPHQDGHDFPSMTMGHAPKFSYKESDEQEVVEREDPSGSYHHRVSTVAAAAVVETKPSGSYQHTVSTVEQPSEKQGQEQQHQESPVNQKRLKAEAARLVVEQKLQRLKLETMASDAETARHQAEENVEKLRLETVAKHADAARIKAEEELEILKMEKMWEQDGRGVVVESSSAPRSEVEAEKLYPEVKDQEARLEAEASRIKAEKELERIKSTRAKAMAAEEEAGKTKLDRMTLESEYDEIDNFRLGYSSDDDDDSRNFKPAGEDSVSEEESSQRALTEKESMPDEEINHNEELPAHYGAQAERRFETPNEMEDNNDRHYPQTPTDEPQEDSSYNRFISPADMIEEPPTISRTPEREIEEVLSSQEDSPPGAVVAKKLKKDDEQHDFPSMNMPHGHISSMEPDEPLSEYYDLELDQAPTDEIDDYEAVMTKENGQQHQPTTMVHDGPNKNSSEPPADEEEETQIHHVARVTFEGDPSKGQLSFLTGSKVEAHSNQRGPWWLGRCGGRTGWFPASAVVPASEFLMGISSVGVNNNNIGNSLNSFADEDENDDEQDVARLSGDELNAVYDLIRNPSDDPREAEEDVCYSSDDNESEGSPAKSRWLGAKSSSAAVPLSSRRDHSPPPSRLDPSEMAGLSERLYEQSHDGDSRSNEVENAVRRRSSSPVISNAEVTHEGKSETPRAETGETTLSKDEPPSQAQSTADLSSKNDVTTDISQTQQSAAASGNTPGVKTNDSSSIKAAPAATNNPKPKPEWRAVKDPKSGLIYYYHTGTRETTWERPPDYVSNKKAPTKSSKPHNPAAATSKDNKSKGRIGKGKGIRGFLSKITKARSFEAEKKVNDQKEELNDSTMKKMELAAKVEASPKETKLDNTPIEAKPQDGIIDRQLPAANEAGGAKLAVATDDVERERRSTDESPQKDFWLTLEDAVSASDDEESDDHSDMSEGTETSMFSKQKIKTKVGKWAGMITEKLHSPRYETLRDSRGNKKLQDDTLELSSAIIDQSREKSSGATSNDEPATKEEEESTPPQVLQMEEDASKTNCDGPFTTEEDITKTDHDEPAHTTEEEKAEGDEVPQDSAEIEPDVKTSKAVAQDEEEVKGINKEPKYDNHSSDKTAKANNIEAINKEGSSCKEAPHDEDATKKLDPVKKHDEAKEKKTQWRSAIDAATGRTYYYIRGTQKVTWEKPSYL